MYKDYSNDKDLTYTCVLELDLSTVVPSVAGPKRPHDFVAVSNLKEDWASCLTSPVGFKGFGIADKDIKNSTKFNFKGEEFELKHGSVVIAAITSCTNTSNPTVMLCAALLCKNAVEKGIKIKSYIKTSLSPGSQAVSKYFDLSGLTKYLN